LPPCELIWWMAMWCSRKIRLPTAIVARRKDFCLTQDR